MADERSASVQVAVRLRPMNDKEKAKDTLPVVTANSARNEVTLIRGSAQRQQRQTYSFDAVFGSFSEQGHVFETIRPLVDDVLQGFEATVRQQPPVEHTPHRPSLTAPPDSARLPEPLHVAGLRVRPDWHGQDAHDGG